MSFIDVSGYDCRRPNPDGTFTYDRPMDWSKQVANGAQFAFIKCSEYVADPGFEVQWGAARKTNLILGAWHYFHPSVNAIAQANLQIGLLKKVGLKWTGDPKTSDKIQLDLENMDGLAPLIVARAAASWYNEVRNSFGPYEIDIYTGWWFWKELSEFMDMSWAKDTKWWLPAYPLDPTPNMINPPAPFNAAQVADLASKAFTQYAMKDLAPWGQPSYRQITAWADSRFVSGHPAIKKVVDVNEVNPNYFKDIPIYPPTPPSSPYSQFVTLYPLNIRSEASQTSKALGVMPAGVTVYIDTQMNGYGHFQPTANFPTGWVFMAYLKRV